jgi:hypothetical protein
MEVAHLHEKVDALGAATAETVVRVRKMEQRLLERRPGN